MFRVFRVETDTMHEWLMHFQTKVLKNGRKYISSEQKTTKKVELMFFDIKVLTER